MTIKSLEIETSTFCNFNCEFCPNRIKRRPTAHMSMDLFKEIINKGLTLGTLETLSTVSFNEPTLDPLYDDRIEFIATTPLKLRLYTNGTGLTPERVNRLAELDILRYIMFEIPSLDEAEFTRLTGNPYGYKRTLQAFVDARAAGLPALISMQGTTLERISSAPAILQNFGQVIAPTWTGDRAGFLQNRYGAFIYMPFPRICKPCRVAETGLYFNIHGDLILCCEDVNYVSSYGNIQDGTIQEILDSPKAKRIRGYALGETDMPKDFLCRHCKVMRDAFTLEQTCPEK